MLHRHFPAAPSRRPTTRAVHRAVRPPGNPPVDEIALRRSLDALDRVIGR